MKNIIAGGLYSVNIEDIRFRVLRDLRKYIGCIDGAVCWVLLFLPHEIPGGQPNLGFGDCFACCHNIVDMSISDKYQIFQIRRIQRYSTSAKALRSFFLRSKICQFPKSQCRGLLAELQPPSATAMLLWETISCPHYFMLCCEMLENNTAGL